MPPTRLVPQPEGTPLPPRDPRIADHWPPDLKQLIDNMLALFPKNPADKPPSVKEVEQKIGIRLTERQLRPDEAFYWSKWYIVSGTRYVDPDALVPEGSDLRGSYAIDTGRYSDGRQTQTLTLVIAPKQSGFCLNPYELAVYTGAAFVNEDVTRHAIPRTWPPSYVWGMFGWSNVGRYGARGFSIAVGIDRDPATQEIKQIGCVHAINVRGRYEGEQQS
jgi:hypothetical protein